jgi:hypothetical protein
MLFCTALACATAPSAALAQRDSVFEGQLINVRGDGQTKEGVVELGGQMSRRGTDGTQLFAISLGREEVYLVFLWKPAADPPKDWSALEGAAVQPWLWTKTYLLRIDDRTGGKDPVARFIDATTQERRRIDGAFELKGKMDIRRFRSNIDFVIDVDLATATNPTRRIKGVVREGDGGAAEADVRPPRKAPAPPNGVKLREPIDAVRAYAEAMRDGDGPKLRALFHTAGKRSEQFVDLYVRWATTSVRLERAAVAKFGRAGADEVMAPLFIPPAGSHGRDLLANLADAAVEAKGDRASVEIEPVGRIELRRVEGQWGMVVPEPPAAADRAGAQNDQTDLLKVVAAVQEAVAPAVESGKLKTAADAVAAIERAAEEALPRIRKSE